MNEMSRRELLRRGAVLGAGVALGSQSLLRSSASAAEPRIVVVGAGLAGMTAAWRIHKRTGWGVQVYEAAHSIGGRTCSVRGLAGGQIAEGGAQGVNSNDKDLRHLVKELGLQLKDTWQHWPTGGGTFYFNNALRTRNETKHGIKKAYAAAGKHFAELPWPLTYANANPAARKWDRMTVAEWIDRYAPGGLDSVLGNYIQNYFEIMYAGPAQEASAIHIIADYGWSGWGPRANYDERYWVDGGNMSVVEEIESRLPAGSVHTRMPLLAMRTKPNGQKICTFDDAGTPVAVAADRVVLALPFSALRDVDMSGAELSPRKMRAIRRLGMGINTKENFQFTSNPWSVNGNGSSLSDLEPGWTWQASSHQPGTEYLITGMNGTLWGGDYGGVWYHTSGPVPVGVANQYLSALSTVYGADVSAAYNGNGYIHNWPANPWVKGSYSYYPVGRWTQVAGAEHGPERGIHFAGEHTAAYTMRGYMNGAVGTGERAAREILSALA